MATTAVSSTSTTNTAATTAATNKANAQKIMTSLGAGSGVDVASLAKNLVDAEKLPKENELNTKISKNEARVSGYSAIMFMMTELKTAFTALKDRNNFNALSSTNSNPNAFGVVTSPNAVAGSHQVEVSRLAKAQRTVSSGLASATTSLNGGKAMTLSLKVGDATAVARSITTRQGVTAATETASVTFQDLAINEEVVVGGLKYTATQPTSAAELATAFANASAVPAKGAFTGSLSGFTASATPSGGTLVFTSTATNSNVTDLAVTTTAGLAPVVTTSQGATAVNEMSTITFKDMTAGQTITVGGLKYTSTGVTTAAQVADAFAGLQAGATTPANPFTGTFSGTLTGFNAGIASGASLSFTSVTTGSNVTDLPVFGAAADVAVANGKDTPQEIVSAINAAKVGVTAQLVNTGDGSDTPYQIILSGPVGTTGAFTLNTSYGVGTGSPGLTFPVGHTANQAASDALVKVDGISYTRSSNELTDVISGITLNLKSETTSAATVDLTRDNSLLKEKFTALVTAYNDADSIMSEVTNPKSTLETYGATLVGDSTVRSLRQQMRAMVSGVSSTPGDSIKTLAQMGVDVDQKGVMSLDETKLDSALSNNYADVVKSFTGGYNNLGVYSTLSAGFAGDAVKKITNIIGSKGALTTNTATANTQNTKYKAELEKLNVRMESLLVRYTKQFGVMEGLVGQVNSQKTSLKSSFDGMMAMYSNK